MGASCCVVRDAYFFRLVRVTVPSFLILLVKYIFEIRKILAGLLCGVNSHLYDPKLVKNLSCSNC